VAYAVQIQRWLHPEIHVLSLEEFMRRLAIIALAVVTAACNRGQAIVGEQSVSFSTPASVDTLMARAGSELSRLGFEATATSEGLLFTAPRPLPDSIAPATGGAPQLWFVHILTEPQRFSAGSSATIRGYLVPAHALPTPGNAVLEYAIPVTDARPAVFNELRRVAEQVRNAATRGLVR
jgi:hypothetical protein